MLIQKCEGIFMPMQLTEQYVFTSCSAMLCCETEMTVCWWSMCLNSSVQMQGDEQLEVLRTDKTLPLMSLQQRHLPFIATPVICVWFWGPQYSLSQAVHGCPTFPGAARSARLAVPRWWSIFICVGVQWDGAGVERNAVTRSETLPAPG